MLRLLHTSDWHLGHTLHDLPRRHEHARFLGWLLDRLSEEAVDALVVAGDVFDTANPSAEAQETLYRFLAAARTRMPALDVVIIGGNHDSAARLDAPDPLLRALGIRVVGGLPREGKRVDAERVIVPLTDRTGEVAAWIAAVPFLRAFDLPAVDAEDPLVEGVRHLYGQILDAARSKRAPGQALLATGHCFMTGGTLSALSERKVLGGNQHALPADIFPDDVAYVALGHLHLGQKVGGRESVRYSGSPIPLSLAEAAYNHHVLIVDLEGEALGGVRIVPIPRSVALLKIPADGPRPIDEVLPLLAALPPVDPAVPLETRPYLEVEVVVPKPEPSLRRRVEKALAGRSARLLRIGVHFEGTKTEVLDAIRQTLGLSYQQFRRSALLAQGDFAAFLRAGAEDRASLLEQMTGTELYSQLSIAARERYKEARDELSRIEAEIGAVQVLAPEERAKLAESLEALGAHRKQAEATLEAVKAALRWYAARSQLQAAEREAVEAERAADEAVRGASDRRRARGPRRRREGDRRRAGARATGRAATRGRGGGGGDRCQQRRDVGRGPRGRARRRPVHHPA